MSVLQSLDCYYDRMADRGDAEPFGYAREKIGFAIVLSAEGEPVQVNDLRTLSGKKLVPSLLPVPALPAKRTVAIACNLLWDKTAYALGRTAGVGRRTMIEHERFRLDNLALVTGSNDEGLIAFRKFVETWRPERFDAWPFAPEMLDANVVFSLDGALGYLHEREAARRLLDARVGSSGPARLCLVSGVEAPIARLHPSIRGVQDAQSAGASLVSFNLDAFTSYGKAQGENAPTSEAAAFRYGAALNRMLDRGSRNRLSRPVGDATVVFWADASDAKVAEGAEWAFGATLEPPEDFQEAATIRSALIDVAKGRAAALPDGLTLSPGTRFHVLGLAPNAARLSVRYWLSDNFEAFARRLSEHSADLQIEPAPWRRSPGVRYLLMKTTALQEKAENVPPLLAGEVMRAVLTGSGYPRSWLAAVIQRLRAGDDASTGWHAAAIRAVLVRQYRLTNQGRPDFDVTKGPPMSLNRESADPAYTCGRLFAALESAQSGALGRVNASIRDRYMGAASATPASVFPLLIRNAQSHLGRMRKDGRGGWLEREIEDIQDKITFSDERGYPRSLRLEAQGRFFLGYYHQRKAQFTRAQVAGEVTPDTLENSDDDE